MKLLCLNIFLNEKKINITNHHTDVEATEVYDTRVLWQK